MTDRLAPGEPVADILKRLQNPLYLPTVDEVSRAFTFSRGPQWAITDFYEFLYDRYNAEVFEYPTKEYIEGLGMYLEERIHEMGKDKVKILGVASGAGRIEHFLQEELDHRMPGVCEVIATDTYQGLSQAQRDRLQLGTTVVRMDYQDALARYQPDIVIGSWIPSRDTYRKPEDWSVAFRRTRSVQEYILIGDPNGRYATETTFGYMRDSAFNTRRDQFPQYAQDGFVKKELKFLRPFQFSFQDGIYPMHSSRTFAFSKITK